MKTSNNEAEIISLESEEMTSISYEIDEIITIHELQININHILSTLTPREERVIRLKYFLNMTSTEIGKCLGCGRNRIYQIEAKALRKLRHPSRSRKIRTYLAFEDHYDNDNNDVLESSYKHDCALLNESIFHLLKNNSDICNKKYIFEDSSEGVIKASNYSYDILITPINNNPGIYSYYKYPFKVVKNTLNLNTVKIAFNKNYTNDLQLNTVMNNIIKKFIECCKEVEYTEITNDYVILTKANLQKLYQEIIYN